MCFCVHVLLNVIFIFEVYKWSLHHHRKRTFDHFLNERPLKMKTVEMKSHLWKRIVEMFLQVIVTCHQHRKTYRMMILLAVHHQWPPPTHLRKPLCDLITAAAVEGCQGRVCFLFVVQIMIAPFTPVDISLRNDGQWLTFQALLVFIVPVD